MKRVGIAALTASLATYGLYKRKEIISYKKPENLVTKTDHMAHAYVLDISGERKADNINGMQQRGAGEIYDSTTFSTLLRGVYQRLRGEMPSQIEDGIAGLKDQVSKLKVKVDSTRSTDELLKIDKEEYRQLLSELAYKKSPEEQVLLAQVLSNAADLYVKLGNVTRDLKYYTKAAVRCQYALSIANKQLGDESTGHEHRVGAEDVKAVSIYQLGHIHSQLLNRCGVTTTNLSLLDHVYLVTDGCSVHTTTHVAVAELAKPLEALSRKDELVALRAYTKAELQRIDVVRKGGDSVGDAQYVKGAQRLFGDISNGMRAYLGNLFQDAEAVLGSPPEGCKYAVIGLGSTALKQVTPYSDLEFAILTDKESPEITTYFKNLSHYVHFKVICLGETTLPASDYQLNMDHLTTPAVNFDLGGKTSLGREDKKYDLIKSVDRMLHYVRNEGDGSEHVDKNLPYILQATCYVSGDHALVEHYQRQVREFLFSDSGDGRPRCEVRAVKMLSEGTVEIDYCGSGEQKATTGNLKQCEFDAYTVSGKIFDVKQEVYRLPDRLVYNLGLIYGVDGKCGAGLEGISAWDIVDELASRGIINTKAAEYLNQMITFATTLRLRTYDYYGGQKERMDIRATPSEAVVATIFRLTPEELSEDGALFKYYYTALPLLDRLKGFCNLSNLRRNEYCAGECSAQEAKQRFFADELFYQDNAANKASIHMRLLRYAESLEHELVHLNELQEAHPDKLHPDVATSLAHVGGIYFMLGNNPYALKYQEKALDIRRELFKESSPDVATSLNDVGITYQELGEYKKALECQEKALGIRHKLFGDKNRDVAESLNDIGITYEELGEYKKALECHEKALAIFIELCGEKHQDVAISLNNIGMTCRDLNDHEKALRYKEKALAIFIELFGEKHPHVAVSLNNIGITYAEIGAPMKALEYDKKALAIRIELFEEKHPYIASSLNNVGMTYRDLGDHVKALEYLERGLAIWEELGIEKHLDVANSLYNVGTTYGKLGNHMKALEYLEKALAIRQELFREKHQHTAKSLNEIGLTYSKLEQYDKALEYLQQALEMSKQLFGGKSSQLIPIYDDLANACEKLGNIDAKQEYKERARECNITL